MISFFYLSLSFLLLSLSFSLRHYEVVENRLEVVSGVFIGREHEKKGRLLVCSYFSISSFDAVILQSLTLRLSTKLFAR